MTTSLRLDTSRGSWLAQDLNREHRWSDVDHSLNDSVTPVGASLQSSESAPAVRREIDLATILRLRAKRS
jgi:hypothetical protein